MFVIFRDQENNTNQNNTDSNLPQSDWVLTRKQKVTNSGKNVGQKEPFNTVGGNIRWYEHYGNHSEHFLKN